jgi:hypothetical protein
LSTFNRTRRNASRVLASLPNVKIIPSSSAIQLASTGILKKLSKEKR